PVVLWGGWPFFGRAWASLVHRSPNMFTLIGLGVTVSYLYSLAATLTNFHARGMYFEAAAVIVVLVQLGQVLELRARSRTGAAIRALLGLAPKTARLVRHDGTDADIPLEHIQPGDRLRVRPGEKVPVDGAVLAGATAGVLFKNAEAIELLGRVDTLVVDKTGTLTRGKPALASVVPVGAWTEQDLLHVAASLERASEHPLASAIVGGARDRGIPLG